LPISYKCKSETEANQLKRSILDKTLRIVAIFLAAILLCSSFTRVSFSAENSVKAMFIYNFSKYFDWSETEIDGNFTIAVFGKTEISDYLIQIAERKQMNSMPVVIKQVNNTSGLANVQMLFIAGNHPVFLKEVNRTIIPGKIIIITENQRMSRNASHINLVNVSDRLEFELNETKLKNQKVKFSKELSSLASKSY